MTKFMDTLTKDDKKKLETIEDKFQEFCDKISEGKDAKFCYYTTGASSLKREISKPLQAGLPAERICKKLGKVDNAICELVYQKKLSFDPATLDEEDVKKKKVKELRKMLSEVNVECVGCAEKEDFVKKVMSLKTKTEL
ncbi:hypothetical protein CYMTET_29260 [Cymbomonas tetramitiformis]|uniref:Mesencephalic astrocyte-derived neurotrophic factor homolog n=1 Tax=Cymbomonas tetramitiformis TaxID=36881 RepID=A0AAE0FLT5_9CHLO|nr:hypothetical protein CYMTET_29260 [Cymbomonas tetramitiformis]